jgi:hypothetical protein
MLIGEGGDLREVGDAEDLLGAAEGFELLADGFGGAASDADVDFVEDERARGGFLFDLVEFDLEEPSSTATLRARSTRESSPPEAISTSGLSGSPGLVAMRYSTESQPAEDQLELSDSRPSGAKAPSFFLPFSARLKSCPDTSCDAWTFLSGPEGPPILRLYCQG